MKTLGKALFWLVLIVSVIVFILPFWFMLCNSFEEFSYVLPGINGIFIYLLLPKFIQIIRI